jgi:HlyD family secretion protein
MQLKVQVDEIDVIEVKLGQKAVIEVDAQADLKLEGQVSFISFLPTLEGGVVMYDVKIGFPMPENSGLRVGMSASADIIIATRTNVLLVPDRAIKQNSQGKTIIEVMVNGQAEERVVVAGISDGLQTEILDGLKEGEMVVERQAKPKTSLPGLFGQ